MAIQNYTIFADNYRKTNPTASKDEIESAYKKLPGGADALQKAIAKNQQLAYTNQQNAQAQYESQYGKLPEGQVYDPYASLRKMAEQRASGQTETPQATMSTKEAQALRNQAGDTSFNYADAFKQGPSYSFSNNSQQDNQSNQDNNFDYSQADQSTQDYISKLQEQLSEQRKISEMQKKELGNVSSQVSDFGAQLQSQQEQVKNLIANLNSKKPGLGDEVNSILQELAQTGEQANLTPESFSMIEKMALEGQVTNIDDQLKSQFQAQQTPQVSGIAEKSPIDELPQDIPAPSKQEYSSLKQSGMNAAQIVQQNPNLVSQVVPDGSIINPGTGVQMIQTPAGEAYKTPSGLIVPKNSSTGFYDLSQISQDQVKKLTYHDVLALDLSTKQTASDLKAFYNAQTFAKMAERNDREYKISELQLDAFYNSETNRINLDQVKNLQTLEIEKMRQELSKDTSLQRLDEAKQKANTIMKAQMDAWGLEGSSAMVSAMSASSLKFEQEASLITKTYDINVKELALASSNVQLDFTNRVTELSQKMQVQKLELKNEYLGRKDEIDRSVLMSNIERVTEQQNMYADYVAKVYDAEQQAQAAQAAAEKEAKAEMWEKQKYYSEQLGMLVSVDENGQPSVLFDDEGNPIETLEGRKFSWDVEKYNKDYDLRIKQFEQDQFQFGIDAQFREMQFNENVRQFGMEFALQQDKQYFDQAMSQANFNFENQKYFDSLNQYDSITWDENAQTYIGKTPTGIVDLGADFGALGVAVPTKSKFEFTVNGKNEVRFNVPLGKKNSRGECGQVVNDALFGGPGRGGFGDSLDSKMKLNNSPGRPVAGGAFIEKVPGLWTGHVGLVEKVNPDGSFEILESNYHGKWNVTRETIHPGSKRWKTIVEQGGFYDPIKGGTSKKIGGNQGGNLVGAGVGPYADFIKKMTGQGMKQKAAEELANKMAAEGRLPGMTDPKAEEKKTTLLSAIQKLKNSKGLSAAVGAKGITNFLPGTQAANFNAQFKNLQSLLTLDNLGILKGAISDKDMEVLKSAATALDPSMSEKEFKATLEEMEKKLSGGVLSNNRQKPKKPGIFANPASMLKYASEMRKLQSQSNTTARSRSGYTFGGSSSQIDDFYTNLLN